MKIRTDFVSNSSSSSFIVIGNKDFVKEDYYGQSITIPTNNIGSAQFGWEFEKYTDFGSKLNWCAILLQDIKWEKDNDRYKIVENDSLYDLNYKKKQQIWMEKYDDFVSMLKEVCLEKFNLHIELGQPNNDFTYYIDHQSDVFESPENGKMFESKEELYNFLASKESYIKTGNDNDDCPAGWYDERERS